MFWAQLVGVNSASIFSSAVFLSLIGYIGDAGGVF